MMQGRNNLKSMYSFARRLRIDHGGSTGSSERRAALMSSGTSTIEESSTTTSTSLVCPVLQETLPELQSRFQKLADTTDDDTFPILSPAIKEKLYQRWNPEDYNDKKASVLIPLFTTQKNDGVVVPSMLFTARSSRVPLNPSEISFPGGHMGSNDTNLIDTALRETQEELLGNYPWRDPSQLVVLGKGTTIPAITGTPVTPIIAVMRQPILVSQHHHHHHHHQQQQQQSSISLQEVFPGDQNEVDTVFGMPLQQLLETEDTHELPDHRLLGKERQGPRYPSPHGHIWGLTAFMLQPLLHKLYKPVFQLKMTNKRK